MDKIKRYVECYIPTETCNLRCHYCYIALKEKFNNKLASFRNSPEKIRKALSKERLGGICLINMCAGGETLLSDEVLPVVKQLLKECHYVMLVTNGTVTKRFDEIAGWPQELLERLIFKFSFHYFELKRLNIIDKFFSNINKVKKAGASITVEITPSDELIPCIEDVKSVCKKYLGTLCHVTIARDDRTDGIEVLSELDFDDYKKTWGTFNSGLFDFKKTIFYKHRNEFCYAGDWSVYLNMDTGELRQCYCGKVLDNIYEDLNRPIKFEAIGNKCPMPHCYNGHSFLTLGDIPELITPTYAEMRNRICDDGTEWLQPRMKQFMSSKLYESNSEYSKMKKFKIDMSLVKLRESLSNYKFYKALHNIKAKVNDKK